jgi:hypothetical protein
MPRKTRAHMQPYQPNYTSEERTNYNREYYIKNRELIQAKYIMSKQSIALDDLTKWKEDKLKDPYALYPFYDPSKDPVVEQSLNKSKELVPISTVGSINL